MATLLSKETLLHQANTWEMSWLLWWLGTSGSSLTLDWCDEDRAWQCSWITGGQRYTGRDDSGTAAGPENAVRIAARAGIEASYTHWASEHMPC